MESKSSTSTRVRQALGDDDEVDCEPVQTAAASGPETFERLARQEAAQLGTDQLDVVARGVAAEMLAGTYGSAREEEEQPEESGNEECDLGSGDLSTVRINLAFAKWYASTEVANKTFWGSLTHADVVALVALRAFNEAPDGTADICVYHRETELSVALDTPLRQTSGGSDAAKHPGLEHERLAGVPRGFVGTSLYQMPRSLRTAFFVGLPDTAEVDICASHQQCIAHRYPFLQAVKAYASETAALRAQWAQELGLEVGELKRLITVACYGGSSSVAGQLHGRAVPQGLAALLAEQDEARRRDVQEHPQWMSIVRAGKARNPQSSLHAAVNFKYERQALEAIAEEARGLGGRLSMPMGDGGVVQGANWARNSSELLARLSQKGVAASIKHFPSDRNAFATYVVNYHREKNLPTPSFETLKAAPDYAWHREAARSLCNRGGPLNVLAVARAIIHHIQPFFAKPAGEFKGLAPVEAWDPDAKQWIPWAGNERLTLAIESALYRTFPNIQMQLASRSTKERLEPVAKVVDRFGDTAFLERILRGVVLILKPMRPLDDETATAHLLHFSSGETLHLGPGETFETQLRLGQPEDRASRSTGNPFVDWQADEETRAEVRSVCDQLNDLWAEGDFTLDVADDGGVDIREALAAGTREAHERVELAKAIRGRLDKLLQKSGLLQFLAPAHSDSWDVTLYELRQIARGASGCMRFEEFEIYYGRKGSNRKSSTLKLLHVTFGSANRLGARGYVCTQKAKYFEQKDTRNAAEPDEGVAAMKGAKFVVIDEFAKVSSTFNVELVKKWTDTDGAPLPFEKKFGARDELRVSWLMIWFTNHLPSFDQADQAFVRRLSILPMDVAFKGVEEYDESDKTHRLADNSFRTGVARLSDELIFWCRCLAPGLHRRLNTTTLRPRPQQVVQATLQEVEALVAPPSQALESQKLADFLDKRVAECKRGELPCSTKEMQAALAAHTGIPPKEAHQHLLSVGCKSQTVYVGKRNVWAYVRDKKPLTLRGASSASASGGQ